MNELLSQKINLRKILTHKRDLIKKNSSISFPLKINKLFYHHLSNVLNQKKVIFFQLRLKKENFKKKLIIGRRIKKICKKFNVKFLINDDVLDTVLEKTLVLGSP